MKIEERVKALEQAVIALSMMILDDSGDVDNVVAREASLKAFIHHAATVYQPQPELEAIAATLREKAELERYRREDPYGD